MKKVLPLLMLCSACSSFGPDQDSSPDKDRLGAVEFKINDLVLDHVSCIDGDKTDWKFFTVPTDGELAVTFAFDDSAAQGNVKIRKSTGEELFDIPYNGGRAQKIFKATHGHYYLEITCGVLQSEYTVEVTYHQ